LREVETEGGYREGNNLVPENYDEEVELERAMNLSRAEADF
jgi:hypothetical protein